MTGDGVGFGARLHACRRAARLSQEELAQRSGLDARTIRNLERGHARWPYPDTVRRLADALDLRDATREAFMAAAGRRLALGTADAHDSEAPASGSASHAARGHALVVPRQLPGAVRDFVGRAGEMTVLSGLLKHAAEAGPGTVLISAIGGTPGVGKTAIAVHWAHRVASQFPDGQLFVNLRGYDQGQQMSAGDALAAFLRALGMAAEDIPDGTDERAAAYRSLLAGRRVLVVLDNAHDVAQVRPLLPGSHGCLTVVTSRDALGGLVAGDGAVRLEVDPLPLPDAVGLLSSLIGSRVEDEHEAAVRLAGQCGRLPLALRVAAELIAARGSAPLADLTAELDDLQFRLDMLEAGRDERTTLRTVFTWSYQDLDPEAARMFRLLGVHPGPDITAPAAASLAGLPIAQARRALRELTRAHLQAEDPPGRFSCHDLLRAYAAEQARQGSEAERHAALQRMLDYYLHTSHAAAMLLEPSREPVTLAPPWPGVTPERLATGQQALAWFDAEHRVLISAVTVAAQAGFDACAWQLGWTLENYLDWQGHWQEWAAIQRIALAAATSLADTAGQATARRLLGHTMARLGDYDQARVHLTQCLELYQQIGDPIGEGRVHQTLGWVAERQDRYTDALGHARQALAIYQATSDQARQAAALNNVGWCHALLGRYQQAREFARQALAMFRELGNLRGEAAAWDSLGYAEYKLGDILQAADCYGRALDIARELGIRYYEAEILTYLGEVHHAAGDLPAARDTWQQALDILADLHHPDAAQVRAKLTRLEVPVRQPGAVGTGPFADGTVTEPRSTSRSPDVRT
jgi:transcriptional regulator with XRE-family HTH domain/Tfp pilus assembly protein PilF